MNFDVLTNFRCVAGFVLFDLKALKTVNSRDGILARDDADSKAAISILTITMDYSDLI
jgi:hypothetical protein